MKAAAFLLLALASPSAALACACDCSLPSAMPSPAAATSAAAGSTSDAASDTAPAPVGHPLRGVIKKILPEKQALLVQHEEIPGVMRAMTMLLKVDAATLAAAKENQAITATLVRLDDGWWLRDVSPAAPRPAE